MKRAISIIALGGGLVLGTSAQAQVAVPNTFISGQPAVAAEVNENFQTLANAINGSVYAYRDYHNYNAVTGGVSCSQKVFTYFNSTNACDTMTRSYAKSGDTLTVTTSVTNSADSSTCMADQLVYQDDGNVFAYTGDGSNVAVATPIPDRTSQMRLGQTWGGGSTVSFTLLGQPTVSTRIDTSTLLGVENNVTVGGTTYNECIKIHHNRSGDFQDVGLYCNGVGLVSLIRTGRIGVDSNDNTAPTVVGTRSAWQLQSCTP